MRRGLIQEQQVNGVTFETGPHAILLSDLSVQHGQFSNMGEFPVLQMMYRQGMIIPNHPGNTGRKPLLLGSREQLNCQMQYIFRGNYGLVSDKEIMEAGISQVQAEQMMALKLKFAFGKIRPSSELLDAMVVEKHPVEIIEGLWIEKVDLNVYKLSHEGNEVVVDMDLPAGKSYAIPYALHHHKIKREYFAVIHSGEGDGWDIHRPSMSSILMFQGHIYLIDAGPNIHHILNHLGIGINEIDGIFHTHSHDDHFAGLTTLMRTDKKIRYFSTPLVRHCVVKKLSSLLAMEEEEFYNYFDPVDLKFDEWNDIQGLEVKPIFSPHPVETSIFEFRTLWENGYMSYAHLADITSRHVLDGMIKEGTPIDKKWVDMVYHQYMSKHTLKKLDIGGGMIHGKAEDFKDDESDKIILCHTSLELDAVQKSIGSGSPFGTVDVLIESQMNVLRGLAEDYLKAYFPSVPAHELNVLLNFPLISFNPESIMMKGGEANLDIYLILTGNVDMIEAESGMNSTISSGAILGEFSGMIGVSIEETYRAQSFVQALRLPGELYYEFVKKNDLYREIEEMADTRWFLQRTWLFGESISTPIQNQIAREIRELAVPEGPVDLTLCKDSLLLVLEGKLTMGLGSREFRDLSQGDFIGEDVCFFDAPPLCDVVSHENSLFYVIPKKVIENIPIVRFKMREVYEAKVNFFMDDDWAEVCLGQEELALGHHQMGVYHRKLRILVMRYVDLLSKGEDEKLILMGLSFVIKRLEHLHRLEERLMEAHDVPEKAAHVDSHRELMTEIQTWSQAHSKVTREEGFAFFKKTLFAHHENFDIPMVAYLNENGVF